MVDQLRYAEKSFEVRFCAALTAAIMPMNRNPKWFGLTQAQERRVGIDTVLGIGGRLLIFQFKAKTDGKIRIDKYQLDCLSGVERSYPNSTFYILPEAEDISAAGKESCVFSHAWSATPSKLAAAFNTTQRTADLHLNPTTSLLERGARTRIAVEKTCTRFGCFCPPSARATATALGHTHGSLLAFLLRDWGATDHDVPLPSFGKEGLGIRVERDRVEASAGAGPLSSAEQFERLLGEGAHKNIGRGAYGLFLAA